MESWTRWTEELHKELQARWNAGESTASIGNAMGCGKNAVVGKASRLKNQGWELQERKSPIKRLAKEIIPAYRVRRRRPVAVLLRFAPEPIVFPDYTSPAPSYIPPRPTGNCQFPHGDPRRPNFRFCDAPITRLGSSYCEPCRLICYQPMRRQEAA